MRIWQTLALIALFGALAFSQYIPGLWLPA